MNYPLLDVFLSMLWFFLWILWIWLVVWILMDVFRSDDMGGWAKAAWTIFIIIIPLFGVLVYLIVRGHSMRDRQMREAQAANQAFDARIREAAGTGGGSSTAQELSKLSELHDRGVLTDAEFERQKNKILAA
jgi:type VI protein secretion system component VasK